MGDAAMLKTTVGILKGIDPDCEISALVSHPEFSRKRCKGLDAELLGWVWPVPEKGKPSLHELLSYPVVFLSNFFSAIVYRLSGAKVFIFNGRQAGPLGKFFDCDVVISAGGDFIGPKYFFVTAFGEFMLAKLLGKKLVICAQTIGPFEGLLNGFLAARIVRLADLIIVRESVTAEALRKLGINDAHLTTDLAFAFPRPSGKKSQGGVVILCPKNIGTGRERYAEKMRTLTRRIMDELEMEVVYLPTDTHDRDFQSEIAAGLEKKVKVIGEVHPPEEIARLISESDFLISSRMHAVILGSLSSTPFFAIGDSHKFKEILDPLCGGCTIGLRQLDDNGVDRILDGIRRRNLLRKEIGSNFGKMREKSMRNATILGEKFREWGLAGKRWKDG